MEILVHFVKEYKYFLYSSRQETLTHFSKKPKIFFFPKQKLGHSS